MKFLLLLNLFLLFGKADVETRKVSGTDEDLAKVFNTAAVEFKAYSSKDPIECYSAKSSKDSIYDHEIVPFPDLLDRMYFPVIPPLPPINPPPCTNVNP